MERLGRGQYCCRSKSLPSLLLFYLELLAAIAKGGEKKEYGGGAKT